MDVAPRGKDKMLFGRLPTNVSFQVTGTSGDPILHGALLFSMKSACCPPIFPKDVSLEVQVTRD